MESKTHVAHCTATLSAQFVRFWPVCTKDIDLTYDVENSNLHRKLDIKVQL